jgi:hypothetical protein
MAIIGNSGSAVTLSPGTTTIAGTVTGNAPAYASFYAAVYGPGATHDNVTVTGAVESTGAGAQDAGIMLGSAGVVTNHGLIEGGAGIVIAGYGNTASYIRNTALIEATGGNAVYVYGNAAVSNTATIIAAGTGVDLRGGGGLFNAGKVTGATGAMLATYYGTGTIYNTGLIAGTYGAGVIIAGTVTNQHSGTITGSAAGLYLYTGSAVGNSGLISGGRVGIGIGGGTLAGSTLASVVDIYNKTGGRIIGGKFGVEAYYQNGPTVQLGNAGLITNGVAIYKGGINNTGSIYGKTGVYLGAGNLITGNRLVGGNIGALIETGAVTLETTLIGSILSTITATLAPTVTNHGYISGGKEAVILLQGGILNNTGDIVSAGTAVQSSAGISLTNSGQISGGSVAVQAAGGAYILNTGSIYASGNAISLTAAASIYNYGVIQSRTAAAIIAPSGYIYNAGLIKGPTAISLTGSSVLYNYGRVSGGITAAINSYIYNAGKIIAGKSGLTLNGAIYGHGVIKLGAGAELIGGTIVHGQQIAFTGAGETLSLTNPGSFHGKIDHFALADTIDLTTIPRGNILSDTFSAGTLTLREASGSIALAFANPGTFTGETFALFADGAGTGITLTGAAAAPAFAAGYLNKPLSRAAGTASPSGGWLNLNPTIQPAPHFVAITL